MPGPGTRTTPESTNERVANFFYLTFTTLLLLGVWQVLHLRSYFKKSALFPLNFLPSPCCFLLLGSPSRGARCGWRAFTAVILESGQARETDHICNTRQNTLSTDESEREKGAPSCSSSAHSPFRCGGDCSSLVFAKARSHFYKQLDLSPVGGFRLDEVSIIRPPEDRSPSDLIAPCLRALFHHSLRCELVLSRRAAATPLHTLYPRLETDEA